MGMVTSGGASDSCEGSMPYISDKTRVISSFEICRKTAKMADLSSSTDTVLSN